MERKVTAQERQILLDNPELVMFEPYRQTSYVWGWLKLLALPSIVIILFFTLGIVFWDFFESHQILFNCMCAIGTILLIAACTFLPVKWAIDAGSGYRKRLANHFAKELKKRLPRDLMCNIGTIQWVVYEKCEGGWTVDGKEDFISYVSFANCFKFTPQTDVAFVYGKNFFAYIKRDPRTESFYG